MGYNYFVKLYTHKVFHVYKIILCISVENHGGGLVRKIFFETEIISIITHQFEKVKRMKVLNHPCFHVE